MTIAPAPLRVMAAAMTLLLLPPGHARGAGPPDGPRAEADDGTPEPSPPPDEAPIAERAEYWFTRGEQLGRDGDLAGAAQAFERSVELIPTANALYNRAVAYEYASLPLEALRAYQDYLGFVDARSTEAEVARQALARVRGQLGAIEPRFERGHLPEQIFVDGTLRSPDEFPVFVLPGDHEVVVVERSGDRRRQRHVLDPGHVWTVDFTRPAPPSVGPTLEPAPSFESTGRERESRITRSLFYTSAAFTGAAGVGVAIFGGLALREDKAYRRELCGAKPECEELGNPNYPADHERRFDRFKLTTNVLIGVTAGLAAVSLVLGVVGFVEPKPARAQTRQRPRFEPGSVEMQF